jgi:NAD(P)-dependent dehydrogenase (short-subunit alcohol dehydrogenase family)
MPHIEDISFDGQTVGVTGGAQGIGKAVSETFASLGADVSIADIAIDTARDVAESISDEHSVQTIAYETDVRHYSEATEWVEHTVDELGGFDVLINNAGGGGGSDSFLDSTPKEWQYTVDLCYFSTLNCTHAVLSHMVDQGRGVVVNFASESYKGNDTSGMSVYGGAKAATVSFTKTVAKEVGSEGVRLNAVSPEMTRTPATEAVIEEFGDEILEDSFAMNRFGRPEDIANTVAFLASDAADWITGEVVSDNGGYYRA